MNGNLKKERMIIVRLYLDATSKKGIGYTPDWIKFIYKDESNVTKEMTLDIQGTIDYDKNKLSCRVKGDLVPWVEYNLENGEEQDYSSEEDVSKIPDTENIVSMLKIATDFIVGIYPVEDSLEEIQEEDDEVLDGEGKIEIFLDGEIFSRNFGFETELNL